MGPGLGGLRGVWLAKAAPYFTSGSLGRPSASPSDVTAQPYKEHKYADTSTSLSCLAVRQCEDKHGEMACMTPPRPPWPSLLGALARATATGVWN